MADKYLNYTGLNYYHNRAKTVFADKDDFDALETTVQGLVNEGGEPNVIEVIEVNGTALPVANKTVDIAVPTNTSDLINDGDGQSDFATEAYVDQNGGKIDTISVNNTPQTITNKSVNITVPTAVSDLTNDSGFQDATQVQALIDDALEDITGLDFEVVQSLPATGQHGIIYLVPKQGATGDVYDEYIWLTPSGGTAHFEQIGTTAIDLSDYWAIADLVAITTAEIDTIIGA